MDSTKDLKHGSSWTYIKYGCRCVLCRFAKHMIQKRYNINNKEKHNERTRLIRKSFIEKNLCSECGWPKEEERQNKRRCGLCNERHTLYQREWRALHYERGFK